MLKRIPSILSPELLYLIAQMGHGDELVIADANFPAVTNAKRLVRADGYSVPAILEAILQLYPLDSYSEKPAAVMRRVDKPGEPAPIWNEYQRLLDSAGGRYIAIEQVERFAFYDRAKQTFGVVATGETALYGNLIIKKFQKARARFDESHAYADGRQHTGVFRADDTAANDGNGAR